MLTKLLAAMTFVLASGLVLAAGPDAGAGYGPGMMGGYGPGTRGGNGPGGYGPGGYGQGMMGGYGQGMMGAYGRGGYGSGMMGGGGPGMMYFGHEMQYSLGLTDEQRKKLDAIHDDMQARNWEIMGKMRGEMAKMRDLSSAEPLDRKALDDTYKRLNDLRQQRFDARLTARSQIEGLLTKEQKEHFKSSGPWWLDETD
jgi:Spy/CpxP family protein refolding chaperone